jgi:nucleoside-diphosphate-sugar epimerase
MKILVTGGAGYIGTTLVPRLLNLGHHVTIIDSFMFQNDFALFSFATHPNLTIIRGDARNEALIKTHLKTTDLIIPLACLVGAPMCKIDPIGAKTINHDAIQLILKHRSSNQPIIFPTTNSGYGVGIDGIYCTEESALNPVSLYGQLKVDIEKQLLDAKNTITLRLATVFGVSPRMRMDLLVNDFTYRAVKDRCVTLFEAHFKRNYISVSDVALAFEHAITQFDTMKNQPYNVGLSDANLSKLELCTLIKTIVPDFAIQESSIGKDPDQRNYIVSNDKIEATGYKPQVSLKQGIEELVKLYQFIKINPYANV